MAKYTVRVELHGVKHEDHLYDRLHDKLALGGFVRTFKGRTVMLPPAEYRWEGQTAPTARDLAKSALGMAAEIIGDRDKVSVIVTGENDFADAGVFKPAEPVFHLVDPNPDADGKPICRLGSVREDDIVRNMPELRGRMNTRGGRYCTICFSD